MPKNYSIIITIINDPNNFVTNIINLVLVKNLYLLSISWSVCLFFNTAIAFVMFTKLLEKLHLQLLKNRETFVVMKRCFKCITKPI